MPRPSWLPDVTTLATDFLLALALSLVLVPLCRLAAVRLGCVARPKQDRWHRRPTALFGGIAISLVVLGLGAVSLPLASLWLVLAGGMLIFIVGLTDDIVGLKPSTKLIAEIALASAFVFFGFRLEWSSSLTLDAMLTMFWIVGITNAFNLLDNMDGLCAGIALIVGTALLVSLASAGGLSEARYLALLLGAIAGFLVYNFHPASIFMGDSGSLFIGLNLAVLSLASVEDTGARTNVLSMVAAPVLILLIPIFDTALVTVSRVLSGRQPSQGGRDHTSHRLVAIGLSERTAVAVLWTLAALGGLTGMAARYVSPDWSGLLVSVFLLAMVIFAVYLAHVRVYEEPDLRILQRTKVTPFVVDFMYKRRVAEVLLDVALVSIAYYAAYRLRFEGEELSHFFQSFLESLPIVLAVQMIALFVVGAYRGVWRYFSFMDGVVFAKGVLFGTLTVVFVIVYLYRFENYSRGVFVIYAALLMLLLTGSRASFRLISEFARRRRAGNRVIVYGAGQRGSLVLRELLESTRESCRIVGFVDDNPELRRVRVQGYPVLGGLDHLGALIAAGVVDSVVISTGRIDVDRLRALERLCAEHGVRLSRLHFDLEELVVTS